ncbi:hypothetical protein PoB_000513700 [Plakobranchus ocellatus]|uniref:C2H2-type domain-containing protein n=1 Tax=Plakobranchus ocellatus TaxID=259542 RepID=A0AAV3Y768_9GAST|nr:hypothetical protein PoB_000513700 [Plakobranchus ocellatus]
MHGMYNHVRMHHLQTEAYICPECQASFKSWRALKEHAHKVHGMATETLRESLRTSTSTNYYCPFCMLALSHTYDLAMHVINAHGDHLLPRQCHLCLQAFVSDPILRIHLAGAHGFHQNVEVDEEEMEEEEDQHSFLQQQQQQHDQEQQQHHQLQEQQQHQQDQQHHLIQPQQNFEHFQSFQSPQRKEAGILLENLQQQEQTDEIAYINDRNKVGALQMEQQPNSGQLYNECTSSEDEVQLLGSHGNEFHLSGVDYLETITNDSIAVGADIIAAADSAHKVQPPQSELTDHQDPLELSYQFEIDGVLYQLTSSLETTGQQQATLDASRTAPDGLTHLLQQ